MLTAKQVTQAAKALYEAEINNSPTAPTSEKFPDATVEDALRWTSGGGVKVTGIGTDAALSGTTAEDPELADTRGLGRLLYASLAFVMCTSAGTSWPLWIFWAGVVLAAISLAGYLLKARREHSQAA